MPVLIRRYVVVSAHPPLQVVALPDAAYKNVQQIRRGVRECAT